MTSNGVRTAQQIYDAYNIMPALQLHQLRVAAVAKTLCENVTRDVDAHAVILASLFHDMGNIIKSDLSLFPDLVEPEGIAHWQLVKDEFIKNYGTDEHEAIATIAEEINLPVRVRILIENLGFSELERTRDEESFEQKIVEYADLRVGPHGVLSMEARIHEASVRYINKHPDMPKLTEEFERLVGAAYNIERQVFSEADIAPGDITEQMVSPMFPALRQYEVV